MIDIYHTIIYNPILNFLVFLYNIFPIKDIGIIIILVTIVLRLILAPFMHKSLKSQKAMSALQPKLNEIRDKHKDDREAQTKAMLELYREHKVNPLSSCLPVLIQLPILFALYGVFNKALHNNLDGLYSFIANPGTLNPSFLGLINLSQFNWALAIMAGIAQYWQSATVIRWQGNRDNSDSMTSAINANMLYILPLMTVGFAWWLKLPSGLALYWIVTTLFAVAQQYYVHRTHKPIVA